MFKNSKSGSFALASAAILFAGSVQASLLIDDFATDQIVTAETGTNPASNQATDYLATDLTGADRTITNTVFGPSSGAVIETQVLGTDGILGISANSFSQGGTSSLLYNGFGSVDFAAQGTAILLQVLTIDTGVAVEMIVNGSTSSGVQGFTGPGEFFVAFADFAPPNDFTAVTSLELIFTGNTPWDGTFRFLRTDEPPTIPTPGTLALLGLGLIGLAPEPEIQGLRPFARLAMLSAAVPALAGNIEKKTSPV